MSFVPLLDGPAAAWEDVDEVEGGTRGTDSDIMTVPYLLSLKHHEFIKVLKESSFRKLGQIQAPSALAFRKLGPELFLTAGSSEASVDVEQFWGKELEMDKEYLEPAWSTRIPLDAYVVKIADVSAPDNTGLVHHVLERFRMGACSHRVFGLPLVQVVLGYKWKTFAWYLLAVELAFFLTWFAGFIVFTLYFQDEDLDASLSDLWSGRTAQGWYGKVTIISEVLALMGMSPFLIIEACTMLEYGLAGWFNIWNGLDVITYIAQISLAVLHLLRLHLHSDWVSTIMAVQHVALCFRLNFFTRVFRATRFSFLDALKEVINEVKWFLLLVLMVVWGFCAAFYIIFRADQSSVSEFATIRSSFLTTFNYALGGVDLNMFENASHNTFTAMFMLFTYQFVMVMVLMSLLVGLMSNAMDRATANEDLKYLQSKAEIVDELETSIPSFVENRLQNWYPKYLHVLRLDVDKLDPILQDMIVSSGNLQGIEGAADGGRKEEEDKKGEGQGGKDGDEDGDDGDGDGDGPSIQEQLRELHSTVAKLTAAISSSSSNGTGSGAGKKKTAAKK